MPTIQIEKDQLRDAALQMSQSELEQFVREIFTLKAREKGPALPEYESALLLKINQGPPLTLQERLNELIQRRQNGTITAAELRELKKIAHQVEQFDAERLNHLTELAHLRSVPLRKLIKQLGLKPISHD